MKENQPNTPAEKRKWLREHGYFVGERDPRLNTKYPGRYMVTEADFEDYELPTEDGSNDPWCIVGDDLNDLTHEAFGVHFDDYHLSQRLNALHCDPERSTAGHVSLVASREDDLPFRVYHDTRPVAAFPSLKLADEFALNLMGETHEPSISTGYHIGRYVPGKVNCPMVYYRSTRNAVIYRTVGTEPLSQGEFEKLCRQMDAIERGFK